MQPREVKFFIMKLSKKIFWVSSKTKVLIAAIIWSGVSIMLITRGMLLAGWSYIAAHPLMIAASVSIGTIKGIFVLEKNAHKNLEQIKLASEPGFFLDFISPKQALLIGLMIAAGFALRASPLPSGIIGAIYLGIGTALSWGSKKMWTGWRLM